MTPNNPIVADLYRDGAALIPKVFEGQALADLQSFCRTFVRNYNCKPFDQHKDSPTAPVYPEDFKGAIEHGARVLERVGFSDVRFHSGALIPKWLDEGRRWFHVDGWYFEDSDEAWAERPAQIGLLCYLDDATTETGALIIVPTSHRREVPGHFDYWETRRPHPDEIVIEAKAGDAVLLDPRTMHAVTPNTKTPNRLCLTLWFMLEYGQLDPRVQKTVMLTAANPQFKQYLGPLAPDYTGNADWFRHVKKPQFPIVFSRISYMRQGKTDAEIIGTAKQIGDDFVDTQETYSWYRAVGAARAPRTILELGVRYGYSAIALIQGAQWAGVQPVYLGIDGEVDGLQTNDIARRNIESVSKGPSTLLKLNTQAVESTNAAIDGYGTFALIHVDGDHSPEGITNELDIAKMWIQPKGIILIDDQDCEHVHAASEKLAEEYGITPIMMPTYHGTMLLDMAKRTRYGR